MNIFVSIIIPVYNDLERLETCLEALENQFYSKDMYEVIVIDNGSDRSIEGVVSHFKQAFCTFENTPGSYAARNKGISLAKGEILAFTDADCIPASNWLETGVEHLLSVPNCGLVAGKIDMFFKNVDNPTIVELYDCITFLNQKKYVEKLKFGATANLFTFKKVFQKIGLFNEKLKSAGDREWGNRVSSFGYSLSYADDCCVAHPARYTFNSLYKKIIRIKRGEGDFDKSNYIDNKQLFIILSDLKPRIRSTWRRVKFERKLRTHKQKVKMFVFLLFVYYVRYWETIKLIF